MQFWTYGAGSYGHQQKTDLGTVTFTAYTSSGVPVAVVGNLYGTADQGVLTVTQLTVGNPAAEPCLFDNLDLRVTVKVHKLPHRVAVN